MSGETIIDYTSMLNLGVNTVFLGNTCTMICSDMLCPLIQTRTKTPELPCCSPRIKYNKLAVVTLLCEVPCVL